jgi:zinc/manganese transport system ATP-binding protein
MARDFMGGFAAMTPSGIHLRNVTIAYGRHPAVHHLNGTFAPGSLTAVAGPNGAGKSTLLKALMNELPLASGTIDRDQMPINDIGYLPQAADIDRRFPLTVGDAVLLGAWRQTGAFRAVSLANATEAGRALSAVGLTGFERRHIGSLSAGQFQRVLFARLLLQNAKVVLLDEPFTAIDARTTRDLLAIVQRWHQDGRMVIAVLHDFEQVRAHFPQTLLLAREPIACGPTATTMTADNLLRARAMAEQWDEDSPTCTVPDRSAA